MAEVALLRWPLKCRLRPVSYTLICSVQEFCTPRGVQKRTLYSICLLTFSLFEFVREVKIMKKLSDVHCATVGLQFANHLRIQSVETHGVYLFSLQSVLMYALKFA